MDEGQGSANNRRFQRMASEVEVTATSEDNYWTGLTMNVSEGGVFIATYEPFPVGTSLEFFLKAPGRSTPYLVRGEVRWVRAVEGDGLPVGIGVRFIEVPDELRDAIHAFVHGDRESIFFDDGLDDP